MQQRLLLYSAVSVGFFAYAIYHAYSSPEASAGILPLLASGNIYSFVRISFHSILLLTCHSDFDKHGLLPPVALRQLRSVDILWAVIATRTQGAHLSNS